MTTIRPGWIKQGILLRMVNMLTCLQAAGKQWLDKEILKKSEKVEMIKEATCWRRQDGMGSLVYVRGLLGKEKDHRRR